MAHYRRDMVLRNLMKALKVNWVVCSTEDGGLNEEQIVNFNKIKVLVQFMGWKGKKIMKKGRRRRK